MLDEAGFTSAAQWYIAGFSQRSGMTVRIDFPPEVARLPETIEIALFRVLQESLTNVHRHSGTSEVEVAFAGTRRLRFLKCETMDGACPRNG